MYISNTPILIFMLYKISKNFMIIYFHEDLNSSRLHPEFGSGISIMRGVSRSFCQLDRLGRPSTPIPPPPQPPFHGTLATRLQCTICSYKVKLKLFFVVSHFPC